MNFVRIENTCLLLIRVRISSEHYSDLPSPQFRFVLLASLTVVSPAPYKYDRPALSIVMSFRRHNAPRQIVNYFYYVSCSVLWDFNTIRRCNVKREKCTRCHLTFCVEQKLMNGRNNSVFVSCCLECEVMYDGFKCSKIYHK